MFRRRRVRSKGANASDSHDHRPLEARAMPNIYEPQYEISQDSEPYVWQRALLGRAAGAQRLGASLFALPPGGTTFPLHAHLHNEELLIVIGGPPTLRTLEAAERTLAPGDVVGFPAGRDGAHQLRNDSAEP